MHFASVFFLRDRKMNYMDNDTIAAISTAVAGAGIGVVRISGAGALSVIDKIYRSKNRKKRISEQPSHTVHYGFIEDDGEVVDEVLVTVMRAPKSFTTEDTVEISCHGGVYAVRRVLDTVIRSGARPAQPGEFTKRAFLNGRIDLSRAEAVIDVIQAENEYALKSSVSQLRGTLYAKIKDLREKMIHEIAFIEAALDDPEHISLDGYAQELEKKAQGFLAEIGKMIASADSGRIMKEGIQTVILGKPNAGKSSLLNALLGEERAIVTDVAGTTRDTLEESLLLDGIQLNLIDTAGIRNTQDVVERIGVERAKEKAERADLIIYVVDASTMPDENDREIIRVLAGKKTVVLLNKSDLPQVTTPEMVRDLTGTGQPVITVSAKERQGIDLLKETVREMFYEGSLSFNDKIYITNARQKTSLRNAENSLRRLLESVRDEMPEDFYSIDLTDACAFLGEITGESVGEDVISEIFGKFCVGK